MHPLSESADLSFGLMSGQDEGDQAAIQAAEPSAADMDQDVEYFGFPAQIRIHVCSNTHTHTRKLYAWVYHCLLNLIDIVQVCGL